MEKEDMKQPNDHVVEGIFSTPIYKANWEFNSWRKEAKEIEDVTKGEMRKIGDLDYHTDNFYIFNTQLEKLKEFCEGHIKKYVKEVINPKEELDFYITSSWINVVKPGGNIGRHSHTNSLISGVFYSTTVEEDTICFFDPNDNRVKCSMAIEPKESTHSNSTVLGLAINDRDLLLFPAWLDHAVIPNEKATKDRISISFNVFARGMFGIRDTLSELIL